eukprot:5813492-Alexandrium_andersonii.AAC.1
MVLRFKVPGLGLGQHQGGERRAPLAELTVVAVGACELLVLLLGDLLLEVDGRASLELAQLFSHLQVHIVGLVAKPQVDDGHALD